MHKDSLDENELVYPHFALAQLNNICLMILHIVLLSSS